tara:strand:- start:288 stop:1904 length:1617 start_codon:yes stop_codon:yes gene_type:complete
MTEPNIILLIIDNLRYDSFNNFHEPRSFLPNLSFLKEKGIFCEIITNGHTTKFVMPSLFTQTFPLDFDGYNKVIKNRPKSFVEILKSDGFKTHMLQGDDNDGPQSGCERGFDYTEALYDRRLLLQNYLEEVLQYEIKKLAKNKNKKKETKKKLNDFKSILLYLALSKNRIKNRKLPNTLLKLNKKWQKKFFDEVKIIDSNPELILKKIQRIDPHLYYLLLGEENFENISFLTKKKIFGILSLIENFFFNNKYLKLKFLAFRKTPFIEDILFSSNQIIKKKKFFIYGHLMDLHDRKLINRPMKFLKKLLIWPFWVLKSKDKSFKRFLYDASLHLMDKEIGNLIKNLKKNGKLSSTKIIITADHGCEMYDSAARGENEIFGFRTHKEHITVPLIYYNSSKKFVNKGLYDSMSISASILDDLNLKAHNSFKGKSIFRNGNNEIISENCGRGNCDIKNKDLYFTVTSRSFKAMFLLKKNKLSIERLYDLKNDEAEVENLINKKNYFHIIKHKTQTLLKERNSVLKKRFIVKKPLSKFYDQLN